MNEIQQARSSHQRVGRVTVMPQASASFKPSQPLCRKCIFSLTEYGYSFITRCTIYSTLAYIDLNLILLSSIHMALLYPRNLESRSLYLYDFQDGAIRQLPSKRTKDGNRPGPIPEIEASLSASYGWIIPRTSLRSVGQ